MDNDPKKNVSQDEDLKADQSSSDGENVDSPQTPEQLELTVVNETDESQINEKIQQTDERAFNTVQIKAFDQFNTNSTEDQSKKSEIHQSLHHSFSKKWVTGGIICFGLLIGSFGVIFGFDLFAQEPQQTKSKTPVKAVKPEKIKMYNLILTHQEEKYQLDLKTVGYDGKSLSSIHDEELRKWLDSVKKQVDQPAVNAQADKVGDPIKLGKYGYYMDTKKISSWLSDLKPYINKLTEIPMVKKRPLVTSSDLRKVDQKQIGHYITVFDGKNVNRTTNIRLASEEINNIILLPGDTFSFNDVVGERTVEKGYKSAGVIVKGEYSEGIGGGICQVSSTLYNSVDQAGLKIKSRFSHSAEVTYVPPGRDATVSWGGPDFRFKNNLNKPVTLKINVGATSISIDTFTVPGAKVTGKSVPDAPKSFTQTKVENPNKPNEDLSDE